MEYAVNKVICPVSETVFQGSSEQALDLDFTLPDYCQDIEKILKCRMCPSVISQNISGDTLSVEGITVIRLYYLDAKKQAVRCCEHTSPFSSSFAVKNASQDMTAMIQLKSNYLNCRALSPRRLDIHGAFSVCAKVIKKAEAEYCTSLEGNDIQQKSHSEMVSTLCGIGQQQFSVSEVLDIGQGKSSPESILRSDLSLRMSTPKAITDKLMLKGEAVLHILYITDIESGSQDTMTFNIPFNQVIDVQGITENSRNFIRTEIMNYDISLKSEYDESSTLITLDAKLCATVCSYEDRNIHLIDDAYSTLYELELGIKPVSLTSLLTELDSTHSVKTEIKTDTSQITKIMDIWGDSVTNIANIDHDQLHLKGKFNCCILALDENQVPFYLEKPVEFHFAPELSEKIAGNIEAVTEIDISSLNFRITGDNTIEVKAELLVKGCIFRTVSCKSVISAEADENRIRTKDKTAALTLYYADEGEELWKIASQYCTSAEAIQMENHLTEEIIEARKMILIPMQ